MPLERFEDWPRRLREAIAAAAETPWAWGRHDCATFACTLIEAMTGTDPAASVRGSYDSEAGAQAVLDAHGGSLEAMATLLAAGHGMAPVHPRLAQRGDLVLVEYRGLQPKTLGIVTGAVAVFAGYPKGTFRLPVLSTAQLAWRC